MVIEIEMVNIGGFESRKDFTLEEGLNIVEAPNAGGKTSFIKGIRSLLLPSATLEGYNDFLNISSRSGNVTLKIGKEQFTRDLVSLGEKLSVSGKPMVEDGETADSLCVATRENRLLDLIEKGESLKPQLEEFSGVRYYQMALSPFVLKKKLNQTNAELARENEEYIALKEYQKQLAAFQKKMERFDKEKEKLPKIPKADSASILKDQELLQEKTIEETKLEVQIVDQDKNIIDRNDWIKRKEADIEECKKQIEEFKSRHPNLDKEISDLESRIQSLTAKRNEIEQESRYTVHRLESIKKAQVGRGKSNMEKCPVCGRPLTLEQLRREEHKLQAIYDQSRKEVGTINNQIEEKDKELNSIMEENQRIKTGMDKGSIKWLDDSQRRLRDLVKERDRAIKEKEENQRKLTEVKKEVEALKKGLDPSVIDIIRKHSDLEKEIGIVKSDIERTEKAIKERGEVGQTIQKLDKRKRFITALTAHLQQESERRVKGAVAAFNEKATEIYRLLEFKDFEKIYIDDYTYEVNVIRKREGHLLKQPIRSLSATERESIGLILMLAGKEKYMPNFPLFVLDAVSEDYDQTRLERFMKYLKEKVQYVVVTMLSPQDRSSMIVVKHSL